MTTRETIFAEVSKERDRQEAKWGEQNHEPFTWLAILGEEVGEANQAAVQAFFDRDVEKWKRYDKELVQIAAVAVSMLECLARNGVPKMHDSDEYKEPAHV